MTELVFDPLLDWMVIAALAIPMALLACFALVRGLKGGLLRLAAASLIALALANPSIVDEDRRAVPDVAVVVVDRSASQSIGDRTVDTDAALAAIVTAAEALPELDLRVVSGADGDIDETRLFDTLSEAFADVPAQRRAGAIVISDGQIHDVPANSDGLGPVHALLTGNPDARDRRVVFVDPPSFGMVGDRVPVVFRVEDTGGGDPVRTTVLANDQVVHDRLVSPDRDTLVWVTLDHTGPTVVEVTAEPTPGELTTVNNTVATTINGVRDRLRVLLVSGEPHMGERVWRNILKSDPSVDLVHFTILRPPESQDGTPIEELSLIAFPVRELFEIRLYDFDLVIFDRYRRRGVLHQTYLDNIARYVEGGGAFLEASGPDFADIFSLYRTPLGRVLPGEPTGLILERGYHPRLTDIGRRHPVTAALADADPDADAVPDWGRWMRQIEVAAVSGETVMTGVDGRPLLMLDRIGNGRVAQLTSDHLWLWRRGFEGGGPQGELLRRLAHWLMREPSLEEEDLSADVVGTRITITRRSLNDDPSAPVTLTAPDGTTQEIDLELVEPGLARAVVTADLPGIHRFTDATQGALAIVGDLSSPELRDVRATADHLADLVNATGGGVAWLRDGVPDLRRVRPDRDAAGTDWIGLRENGAYEIAGTRWIPLLPAWAALAALLLPLIAAWRREGA